MRKTLNDHTIITIISMYLDGNNLYEWRMSQKLPVNGFKLERKISINLINNSLKTITLIVIIKDIFLKQMLNIQKIYIVIYHFYHQEKK